MPPGPDPGPAGVDVDEPLALSAPLAWRLAAALCRPDPTTGEPCAWYHGLWQYLRLMRLVDPLSNHAAFFREAFATLSGRARTQPRPRLEGDSTAEAW